MLFFVSGFAQNPAQNDSTGHANENYFRQLYETFATPNQYRTASGAPGPAYYQNTADYVMDIRLDDENQKLYGFETITYTNNSPNDLEYLWVQLDQNIRSKESPAAERNSDWFQPFTQPADFVSEYMMEDTFDGGFKLQEVTHNGKPLDYFVNFTMMRINLNEPLKAGESFEFSIKWWYNINNYMEVDGRSGYEHFEEHGNNLYVIAQFFPRMAVYNDKEGWQNHQFWGDGEFALPFGNYEVSIAVPADHILEATGTLQNREEVYSKKMMERYEKAKKSFDKPVLIVTQEEAEKNESKKPGKNKNQTWKFKADMVRDFAFSSSRKFILEMKNTKIGDNEVMAISMYPKEGNPLWGEYATKAIEQTLKTYSKHTFTYPYPKAVAVNARNQGMEYPMICWNFGRPDADGTYSDDVKFGMIGVIIHEVGHNFFPMIVNSDERQWGWLDEGLNTFLEYLTQLNFGETYPEAIAPLDRYPVDRGDADLIVNYMKGNQKYMTPIMSNPENVYQLGNNAYGKVGAGLNILRQTILGPELFDYAFQTYAQRWMFKHPTPDDFFRTMEDASGTDLDWFWRGWFYRTDYVDIGIKEVNLYTINDQPNEQAKSLLKKWGITNPEESKWAKELIYFSTTDNAPDNFYKNAPDFKKYIETNFSKEEQAKMKIPNYLYEVVFEKPGKMPMPIIVEFTFEDGTSKRMTYPVEIWRKNPDKASKVLATQKKIVSIQLDPDLHTADVNTENNVWKK
ncbi:MAG TPA: M1 family metallopeptidase [Flavobacteriaceae bacterium]|nr:M1 family metallopeptidase [Flavobacteriaceae bacterium]